MGLIPAGAYANRTYFSAWVSIGPDVTAERSDLMFDPQTSGGLVLGIRSEQANQLMESLLTQGVDRSALIGEVLGPDDVGHVEIV